MAVKPQNHVTLGRFNNLVYRPGTSPEIGTELPVLREEDLKALEAYLPARCYDPASEDLETHLAYSGMHLLTTMLRQVYAERPTASTNGVEVREDGELVEPDDDREEE